MRILVTGHLGYIGVETTSLLVDLGHEVVGLDTDLFAECDFLAGRSLEALAAAARSTTPSAKYWTIRAANRLATPHYGVHELGSGAFRTALRERPHRASAQCYQHERRKEGRSYHQVRLAAHALKISLLPVDVLMTLPGICARASSRKFSPLQCIGMSTSGSSFFTSATTSLR